MSDSAYVEVDFTTSGQPHRIVRSGRTWHVGATPVHWFERIPWWRDELRMPRGGGVRVEVEVWLVQVRLGGRRSSDLVSWELVHEPNSGRWRVRPPSLGTGT